MNQFSYYYPTDDYYYYYDDDYSSYSNDDGSSSSNDDGSSPSYSNDDGSPSYSSSSYSSSSSSSSYSSSSYSSSSSSTTSSSTSIPSSTASGETRRLRGSTVTATVGKTEDKKRHVSKEVKKEEKLTRHHPGVVASSAAAAAAHKKKTGALPAASNKNKHVPTRKSRQQHRPAGTKLATTVPVQHKNMKKMRKNHHIHGKEKKRIVHRVKESQAIAIDSLPAVHTHRPSARPTASPTFNSVDDLPTCDESFYSASNTNSARQNTVNCKFTACSHLKLTLLVTMCGTTDTGGDTYLRLFNATSSEELAFNDDSCVSVSSTIIYYTEDTGCQDYILAQGCYSSNYCQGSVEIIMTFDNTTVVDDDEYSVNNVYYDDYSYSANGHELYTTSQCVGQNYTLPGFVKATARPTRAPTEAPTIAVTQSPSVAPMIEVTQLPSVTPTITMTQSPSAAPTVLLTQAPSYASSQTPSFFPSIAATTVPSRAPTRAPTVTPGTTNTPTRAPSSSPAAVSIAVTQTISGISYSNYVSNTNYTATLKSSIAGCMTGVSSSDIVNLVVTDGSSTTTAAAASVITHMRKKHVEAASDSIIADYDVYVADSTSSGVTYDSLVAQLTVAVSGTTFTSLLATYSVIYSTPVFVNATSTIASIADSSSTGSSSSKNDNDLSNGAIAGIVIGCVVIFVLCVAIVAFKLGKMAGAESNYDDEVHVEVEMTPSAKDPDTLDRNMSSQQSGSSFYYASSPAVGDDAAVVSPPPPPQEKLTTVVIASNNEAVLDKEY